MSNRTDMTQLRLIIPKEWVAELDALASFRVISRLALIRLFIREALNNELQNFDDQVKGLSALKRDLFRKQQELDRLHGKD